METYVPYIVSVVCAAIAGFASYAVARKQAKADIERLIKQHELDIEKEREKFTMEKEKWNWSTNTSWSYSRKKWRTNWVQMLFPP